MAFQSKFHQCEFKHFLFLLNVWNLLQIILAMRCKPLATVAASSKRCWRTNVAKDEPYFDNSSHVFHMKHICDCHIVIKWLNTIRGIINRRGLPFSCGKMQPSHMNNIYREPKWDSWSRLWENCTIQHLYYSRLLINIIWLSLPTIFS